MANVAGESSVIRKILSQNSQRKEESDTGSSFAFVHGGRTFFIPKAPDGAGYELELLESIEQTLANIGLDLLPLDHFLN
jgi:hypothetical protein